MTTVLVVEDEKSLLEPLVFLLEKEGFTVAGVENGSDALKVFAKVKPDIVLLDLMLPGMSGTEICREIRTHSSVPIIMLTAKDGEVDKVVGLELTNRRLQDEVNRLKTLVPKGKK